MLQAPAGSQTRQRMLSDINKLAMVATASGAVSKPANLMTDEDLMKELESRQVRLQKLMGPDGIKVETVEETVDDD
jgi:hypothetical protein